VQIAVGAYYRIFSWMCDYRLLWVLSFSGLGIPRVSIVKSKSLGLGGTSDYLGRFLRLFLIWFSWKGLGAFQSDEIPIHVSKDKWLQRFKLVRVQGFLFFFSPFRSDAELNLLQVIRI